MDLDLNFDDGNIRNFTTTHQHASLIMFVADSSDGISLSDLASISEMEPIEVKKKMGFWISRLVVSINLGADGSDDIIYRVIEDQSNNLDMDCDDTQSNFEEVDTL